MNTERGLNEACFECWFKKDGKCELEDMIKKASAEGVSRSEVIGSLDTEKVNRLIEQGCPNVDSILPRGQ